MQGPNPKRKVRKSGGQRQQTSGEHLFEIIMAGKEALQVRGREGKGEKGKERKCMGYIHLMLTILSFSLSSALTLLVQSVASEWVDRYEKDAEAAMVELIQFVVLCCGCKAPITLAMFQEEDTQNIIRSLTENFAEVSLRSDWSVFFFHCDWSVVLYSDWSHFHCIGEWRVPSHYDRTHIQEIQGSIEYCMLQSPPYDSQ